mmetsp:Transcript_65544/g.118054  ORF Transcript_65544/g.118054 Transcript_65544/m.118054 type:complete len:241 (-) Transcript_65544:100-822(-)
MTSCVANPTPCSSRISRLSASLASTQPEETQTRSVGRSAIQSLNWRFPRLHGRRLQLKSSSCQSRSFSRGCSGSHRSRNCRSSRWRFKSKGKCKRRRNSKRKWKSSRSRGSRTRSHLRWSSSSTRQYTIHSNKSKDSRNKSLDNSKLKNNGKSCNSNCDSRKNNQHKNTNSNSKTITMSSSIISSSRNRSDLFCQQAPVCNFLLCRCCHRGSRRKLHLHLQRDPCRQKRSTKSSEEERGF